MNRRQFIAGGCACCASALANAQAWEAPARFTRPDVATDEGGLWALTDREETRVRRSPFVMRDAKLRDYVQGIACRLAGDHCPDLRVHLVRTPHFNASMFPNGMMQIWTGLLLRVENEAQLAAIIGHEIGHYLERHAVERLRDVRARSAFGNFLALFGLAGAIGQLVMLAGMFAYSREQEREADRIGVLLMKKAGYDPAEAPNVWGNLLLEIRARPDSDPERASPLFATHPSPDERQQALQRLVEPRGGGTTNEGIWIEHLRPHRREWLLEEIQRGQHEESIALFSRQIARVPREADFRFARAEVYRLRARDGDWDAAIEDYSAAIDAGGEPAETHRGLGLVYRNLKQPEYARSSFERYLKSAPDAPDAAMIRTYIEESRT